MCGANVASETGLGRESRPQTLTIRAPNSTLAAAAASTGCALLPLAAPQEKALQDAIKEAEQVCEGGAAGECAAAWDNVSFRCCCGGQREGRGREQQKEGQVLPLPWVCVPRSAERAATLSSSLPSSLRGPFSRPIVPQVEEISAAISHKKANEVRGWQRRGAGERRRAAARVRCAARVIAAARRRALTREADAVAIIALSPHAEA